MHKVFRVLILAGCFFTTLGALILSNAIEGLIPEWRPFVAAFAGSILAFILYLFISYLQKFSVIKFQCPLLSQESWLGLAYAGVAFAASISFQQEQIGAPGSDIAPVIIEQMLFQLRPALIEEVGFRFGIVVFALGFFGFFPAIIAGSIPFGLLHIMNFISGLPIDWLYIIGTSVAGLFLTLLFLNYGLAAAIIAHYSWNVLASVTANIFKISQVEIEGSLSTLAILTLFSCWLYYSAVRRQLHLVQPPS